MTPQELKMHLENKGSKHFTRENMRFAGDSMGNYGVRSATITTMELNEAGTHYNVPTKIEVWELYRKKPVMYNLQKSAYFTKDTFKGVYNHE